jgi:hypothetical protein
MGPYYGYNDAVVNAGITPNGSNPLYAIVTASVNDAAYTGNPGVTAGTWNFLVTQGTAAPSPTIPATPANSLLLAVVLVPAAASSSAAYTITDSRTLLSIGNYLDIRGNPTGRLFASTQTVIASGVGGAQVTGMTTDFLRGGMTVASNSLVVPVAGIYRVSASIEWQFSGGVVAAGALITTIKKNGTAVREWQSYNGASSTAGPGGSDDILCAAGDTLSLNGSQGSGSNAGTRPNSSALQYTWLASELVSI